MIVLGLAVLYFLIIAPELFLPANPESAQLQALAKALNSGLHIALMIAALVKVIKLIVDGAKFAGRKLGQTSHATVL